MVLMGSLVAHACGHRTVVQEYRSSNVAKFLLCGALAGSMEKLPVGKLGLTWRRGFNLPHFYLNQQTRETRLMRCSHAMVCVLTRPFCKHEPEAATLATNVPCN